jgi:hypothetical protein
MISLENGLHFLLSSLLIFQVKAGKLINDPKALRCLIVFRNFPVEINARNIPDVLFILRSFFFWKPC